MSRSRKKSHWIVDHHAKTSKEQKRIANKKLRQDKNFDINGSAYKKRTESWDICDFRWAWTKKEAIKEWYDEEAPHYNRFAWRHARFSSLEEWLNYWAKCVQRK